ncbi:MAG: hypothetical protein KGL39_37675 [Patescibacteria group bacterium]|nr:hypothetical protein [Patescibacteria group bacterium]
MGRKNSSVLESEELEAAVAEATEVSEDGVWVEATEDLMEKPEPSPIPVTKKFKFLTPSKEFKQALHEVKPCGSMSRIRYVRNAYIFTDDIRRQECFVPFDRVAEVYERITGRPLKKPKD